MNTNSNQIQELTNTYVQEAEKFWGGNNAAGSRARKSLMELVKVAKAERKAIQEEKNNRKAQKTAA
jgi:hypothetical protein